MTPSSAAGACLERHNRAVTRTNARWLLVFNCQGIGLANCLELLSPGLEVEFVELQGHGEKIDALMSGIGGYDRLVVDPRLKDVVWLQQPGLPPVQWMPCVWFQGYHPDIVYLAASGALSRGPLGHYHSALVHSAFVCGRSQADTLELFRADVFEALGYLDAWRGARDAMLDGFRLCGLDLHAEWVGWARQGPFMHTQNHPHIRVLFDLARRLLEASGRPLCHAGVVPHDNLANGPVFPVYPEVAATLGVRGSYCFKPGGGYGLIGLDEYIAGCFDVYASAGTEQPDFERFLPQLQRTRTLVERLS